MRPRNLDVRRRISQGNDNQKCLYEVTKHGEDRTITLNDVYLEPQLARNIVSYDKLKQKGFGLVYRASDLSIVRRSDGEIAFDVSMQMNVLYVKTSATPVGQRTQEMFEWLYYSTQGQACQQTMCRVYHLCTSMHVWDTCSLTRSNEWKRLLVRVSRTINHNWTVCNSCKEGKQKNNQQFRKNTRKNAPINRIGVAICSDLEGLLIPRDRIGNRYLINFVDHMSNYYRVFLAPTKDEAAKRFEDLVLFYKRMVECKIYML